MPETPVPDYGDAATPENQNVFKFAKKFQTVLTNIQKIGILPIIPCTACHILVCNITGSNRNKAGLNLIFYAFCCFLV